LSIGSHRKLIPTKHAKAELVDTAPSIRLRHYITLKFKVKKMPKHFSHSTNTIKLFRNYGNDAKNYEILVRFCRFEGLQGI